MNELGRNILAKLDEILSYSKNNEKKLMQLDAQHREMYNMIKGFMKMGITTQVPNMTPKQLTIMHDRGSSLEELSYISGYSINDIETKIKIYKYKSSIQM